MYVCHVPYRGRDAVCSDKARVQDILWVIEMYADSPLYIAGWEGISSSR